MPCSGTVKVIVLAHEINSVQTPWHDSIISIAEYERLLDEMIRRKI